MKKSILTFTFTLLAFATLAQSLDSAQAANTSPTLNLSGPRMGFTFFTGEDAKTLSAPTSEGGFDSRPVFFQMGYQFEKQYLSSGNFQGLVEFIPMISGMDQGYFIPSITLMNGFRNNRTGFEFAFGPTINISRETQKYEHEGKWYRPEDRPSETPVELKHKMDSRGYGRMKTYMVFAFGYSFKSGNLNIPVNAYLASSKNDPRVGISIGFNAWK
ncbi:MAG: hypothetical protein COA58_09545 [Bacteroidetes bacterium]|nr:MAG: hypothetical protein COA58_09545 [Bacteroidota bacterium]